MLNLRSKLFLLFFTARIKTWNFRMNNEKFIKKHQIIENNFTIWRHKKFPIQEMKNRYFFFYKELTRNLILEKGGIQFGVAFRIGSTVRVNWTSIEPAFAEIDGNGPIVSRVRNIPICAYRSNERERYAMFGRVARRARSLRTTQGHPITLPPCGSITSLTVRFSVCRYEMPARTSFYPTTSSGWSCKGSPTTSTGAYRRRPTTTRSSSASPPTCRIYRTAPVNEKARQRL